MIKTSATDRAAALRTLHAGPGFIIPNAWNGGSARILEQAGFPAIATTSSGVAWSCGVPDGGKLGGETMLECVARIAAAVNVPVTADLEDGYGQTPDDVAATIARAVELGLVGANLEDAGAGRLYDIDEATERVAAARAAAPADRFVLNARTDIYLSHAPGDRFAQTVERATRYIAAGADCIFVPGVSDPETVRALTSAIQHPVNMLAGAINPPDLISLGVTRVSVGGSMARAALGVVERAAQELFESGTLGFLDGAPGHGDLQRRFG